MAETLQESNLRVTASGGGIIVQGATDKRMTVLSISVCETAGNDETFSVWFTDLDGSSNVAYVYFEQSLPGKSTFIHSDKIVLNATDELWLGSPSGSADIDVVTSYLEQDV